MPRQERVTLAEAAKLTGLSQLEIGRLIENRRLSLDTGADRKKTISHASLKGVNGYVPPEAPPDPPRPAPPRPDQAPEPEAAWEPSAAQMAAIVRLDDRGRAEMIADLARQHPTARAYFRNNPLPPVHKRAAPPPPPPPPPPEPVSPPFVKPEPLFTSPLKFSFTFSGYDLKGLTRRESPTPTPTPPPQDPVRPPASTPAPMPVPVQFDRPTVYRIALVLGALGFGAYLTAPRRPSPLPWPPQPSVTPSTRRPVPAVIRHAPRPKRPVVRTAPLPHPAMPPPITVQPQPAPGPPIGWYPGTLPPLRNPYQPYGRP